MAKEIYFFLFILIIDFLSLSKTTWEIYIYIKTQLHYKMYNLKEKNALGVIT